MSKALKIEIDVSMYESIAELKSSGTVADIVSKINHILKKKDKN